MRPDQVHQLAGGQVGDEPALGFGLDLLPPRFRNGCQVSVEVVHHSPPFRLPMPSEPLADAPLVPASVSCSTSVTGSVVKR